MKSLTMLLTCISTLSSRRRSFGFTLIELLVVLAIVATLLMLVTPRYSQRIDTARETVLLDTLQTTRRVIEQFHADKGRYPDSLAELVETHYLREVPSDPITESRDTWRVVRPPEGYEGEVYDIKSGSDGLAKTGVPYAEW